MMNPYVEHVKPKNDYQLVLWFKNGERRIFDMRPYLEIGVFKRLKNRAVFQAARVIAGSVEWPGDVDLSYDTLYVESQPVKGMGGGEGEKAGEELEELSE